MTRKPFILRTDDIHCDDFGELFTQMFGSLYARMPPLFEGISVGGVYARFAGMSIRRMQYGGDFSIHLSTQQDEISFVLPSAGSIIFDHRGQSIGCAQVGLAVDKRDIRAVHFADNHGHCGMSIRRELFPERLSLLLDQPLAKPVCFAPEVNLALPVIQSIGALLEMATGKQFDPLISNGVLTPTRLQDMLVDAALEGWPHNYSDALRRPAPALAPRHVKRVMTYLREHPLRQASGAELAGLANVSLRALQEGFRRFAGTSIVAYQRQVRLESARQVLARGEVGSVAEVALQHGFTNAGRFAQYFQQAFGVTPADVRRGDWHSLTPAQPAPGSTTQNA